MRTPFVMGNWKLNGSKQMTSDLIHALKEKVNGIKNCTVAIAPPFIYLDLASQQLSGSTIQLGAQDVGTHLSGAFTGETSAEMLKDIGAKYIIIGHSERRMYHYESNEFIAQKFAILKENGLIPVLCIGETEQENMNGETETVCKRQLDAILKTQGAIAFNNTVIAYEPVWAIGTGKSATPAQAQNVHHFIRGYIAEFDQNIAEKVTILYGGSVNDSNAAELFTQPDIDGALVGGASLKANAFSEIVIAAAKSKN